MVKNQIIVKFGDGLSKPNMGNIRKRYKKTICIGNVLESLIQTITERKNSQLLLIELIWQRHLEREIADNSKPAIFRNGTLTVNTNNHIWQNELLYRRETLIQMINSHLGNEVVKEIVVKVKSN